MRKFTQEELENTHLLNKIDIEEKSNKILSREAGFKKERKCNNSKRTKPRKKKR